MIDPNDLKYLTTEDYLRLNADLTSAIRDLTSDLELLNKIFITDSYLDQDDVASFLHCDKTKIPRAIPCAHIGRNYLYKRSDIEKFMQTNTKSRG